MPTGVPAVKKDGAEGGEPAHHGPKRVVLAKKESMLGMKRTLTSPVAKNTDEKKRMGMSGSVNQRPKFGDDTCKEVTITDVSPYDTKDLGKKKPEPKKKKVMKATKVDALHGIAGRRKSRCPDLTVDELEEEGRQWVDSLTKEEIFEQGVCGLHVFLLCAAHEFPLPIHSLLLPSCSQTPGWRSTTRHTALPNATCRVVWPPPAFCCNFRVSVSPPRSDFTKS